MESPKHLKHKPIISVNDYDEIDAQYKGSTDVKALSIGKAQYNDVEISLKVWRHTGGKWSRMSEELALHRNIDLSILLLGALITNKDSNYPGTLLREVVDDEVGVDLIKTYYKSNEKFLKPRLEELKNRLNEFLK